MQRSIEGRASILERAREGWQAAGARIREAPLAFPMLVGWCCGALALAIRAALGQPRPPPTVGPGSLSRGQHGWRLCPGLSTACC